MDSRHRTGALDAFLARGAEDDGVAIRMSEEEAYATLARALAPVHGPGLEAAPELHPHLILALWRFARALLNELGHLAEDERLENCARHLQLDPGWSKPLPLPKATPANSALQRTTTVELTKLAGLGLAIMCPPPSVHPDFVQGWTHAVEMILSDLGLVSPMTAGPMSRECFRLLTDETAAPRVAVTPTQICAFEELILDECGRLLVSSGERATIDHFRHTYHLARKEATALVRLARADALAIGKSSVEEDRAVLIAMLKDMVTRAKESLNVGDELRALKELAKVQGLTRTDPENAGEDFAGVISRVAAKQDSALESAAKLRQEAIDTGRAPADAPYFPPEPVKEGDVLVEFDEENASK